MRNGTLILYNDSMTITLTKSDLQELMMGRTLEGFKGTKVKVRLDKSWVHNSLVSYFLSDDD